MKQGWKRMLTVALAIVFALSVLPQNLAAAEATASAAYGKVTADQVYLRKQPSTSADYWFRMDTNHVAEILDIVSGGGKTWYKVVTDHPNNNGREYTGYIMSDFFAPLSAEEAEQVTNGGSLATATPAPVVPTAGPSETTGSSTVVGNQIGEITAGEVNFRAAAGMSGGLIMKLDRGTIVELLSIPDTIDSEHWFRIRYAGYEGYVRSDFVRVLSNTTGTSGLTVHGYVKLITDTANLRRTPDGDKINTWRTKGEILPYVSTPVQKDGYTWYEVYYGGYQLWVRSDCVQLVDSTGHGITGSSGNTSTATGTPQPSTSTAGYVVTTKSGVNLRLLPFGEHIVQIKKGVVLPYTRIVPPYSSGNNSAYTWYYVNYTVNGSVVSGYVRSDCVEISGGEANATSAPTTAPGTGTTAVPTSAPGTSVSYVKTVKTDVAFRKTPGGVVLDRVPLGTVATVTGETRKASNYNWYPVRLNDGRTGYLRGDCVVPCESNGNTGSSGNAPTPTPSTGSYGYVQITMDRTNIRTSMGGKVLVQLPTKGGIYPMWGPASSKNNVTWYPVIVNGQNAWVRSDCAKIVSGDSQDDTPTTAPSTAPSTASTYVITTLNDVNLRASASKDATSVTVVPLGTVMAYNTTLSSGGDLWYRVIYNNQQVWVLGTCVKVMTQAEYDEWLAENPNQAPQTSVIMGYVKTTVGNVNIRKTANGTFADRRVEEKGTVLPYTEKQMVRNTPWYYIETSDGFRGWITGEYAVETTSDGTVVATTTPAPTTTPGPSGTYRPSTAGQEASYTTLKYGSSGQAVTNLVTELKLQGYYNGEITSSYTRAVEDAVKAFQKAKGLTVDGIAGSATQHALFQTVPVGTGSSENFTFYPAEKIDWFTGGIQQQWPKGSNAKIYDVKTGIVWTARRWSGGNHSEVEPLTAADTARLCKTYGVSKSSQIPWNYRPVLVLVGQHNYCASIYAEEHTGPNDGVISNNNYEGTMCVWFSNSKTHGTGVVVEGHMTDIEYAYQHAPGGQK